jgi:hypothetical protein
MSDICHTSAIASWPSCCHVDCHTSCTHGLNGVSCMFGAGFLLKKPLGWAPCCCPSLLSLLYFAFRLMLPEEPPSAPPKNIVASGRTNQSIMVQWQPPPETEHNGVLRGYILRQVPRTGLQGVPLTVQVK